MLKHRKILLISIFVMLMFLTVSGVCAAEDNMTDDSNLESVKIDIIGEDLNAETFNEIESENELETGDENNLTSDEEGYVDPSEAYECLNEYRQESGAWFWDYDDVHVIYFNTNDNNQLLPLVIDHELEKAAKIRAKEIVELFEHTRPDGTECFTVYPSYMALGENLVISTTGREATESWKENFLPYELQGHRRNMLTPLFNSVGIAGYKASDGWTYWVQAFGRNFITVNGTTNEEPQRDYSKATFKDLNDLILNSNEIVLDKDYAYFNDTEFNEGIVISKSLTIDGRGHTIDANKFARIFNISSGNVILKNIKFANGYVDYNYGGAIFCNNSDVSVINCSFTENFAYYGSAISSTNANVTIKDSTFSNNFGIEGTVYADNSDVNVANSDFEKNSVILYGAGLALNYSNISIADITITNAEGYNGGALYLRNSKGNIKKSNLNDNMALLTGGAVNIIGGNITFEDSVFTNNFVNADNNIIHGGALYLSKADLTLNNCTFADNIAGIYGGALCIFESNATLKDCNFINNSLNSTYFTQRGGAIYLEDGKISLDNCDFEKNNGQFGGSLYFLNSNATLSVCEFSENHVVSNGACMLFENVKANVVDCNFDNNFADFSGGVLYLLHTDITFLNSNFTNNVGCFGGVISSSSINLTALNCKFENNRADSEGGTYGGAIHFLGGNATFEDCSFINNHALSEAYTRLGGAMYITDAEIFLKNTHFDNNSASTADALHLTRSNLQALNCSFENSNPDGYALIYLINSEGSISDSTFANLTSSGPAALALSDSDLTLSNSNFTNISSTSNGCAMSSYGGNISINDCNFINSKGRINNYNNGGALSLSNGNVLITNSNFINNHVDNYGGAIHLSNCHSKIVGSNFTNNSINSEYYANGGAIYSEAGNLSIENSKFFDNFVNSIYGACGGAVYASNNIASIINSYFSNNTALEGGAITLNNANVTVENSVFENGNALGGGSISASKGNLIVNSCDFKDSHADSGGALYLIESVFSTKDSIFVNCTSNNGGAIFGYMTNGTVMKSNFTKNSAESDGGAIYIYLGKVSLTDSIFTNNTAGSTGGAVYGCDATRCDFIDNTANAAGALCGVKNTATSCSFIRNVAHSDNPTYDVTCKDCTFIDNKLIISAEFYISYVEELYYSGDVLYYNLATFDYQPITNATVTVRAYKDNVLETTYNMSSDGNFIINLSEGTYTVEFSVENQDYEVKPVNVTLNVAKRQTANITLNINNETYLKPTLADITSSVDGYADVYIDGEYFENIYLAGNEKTQRTYYSLNSGKHTLTITVHPTDSRIASSTVTEEFEVYKKQTQITLDVKDASEDEDVIVNVTASEDGDVAVKVGETVKNIHLFANQKTQINFGTLKSGNYSVEASFNAGENYIESKALKSIKVSAKIAQEDVKITKPDKDSSDIVISLPSDAKGKVTLNIAGKNYDAEIVNGSVKVELPELEAGDYEYTITYSGDEKYDGFEISGSLNMRSDSENITIKPDVDIPPFSDGDNEVKLPSDATGTVTLTIDGKVYQFPVVNGVANIVMPDLPAGDHSYTIAYSGDGKYSSFTNQGSMSVKAIATEIESASLTTLYNGGKYIVATLKDEAGNPLIGFVVLVNINSKTTNLTTDDNGQVKLTTNALAPKTSYAATITFEGDSKYSPSTKTVKVTVKKATPKLTAKAKTFKKSVKIKKYVVTLKTNKNKVMKNTKVTLKVNGKTYSAKTNSKGQATIKINKLTKKGKFIATIKYAGNKYYNAKTVKAKITVK